MSEKSDKPEKLEKKSLSAALVNRPEPLPTAGAQDVFPQIYEDLRKEAKGDKSTVIIAGVAVPLVDVLIQELEERRQIGIKKYGRPLQTFNGRDALKDAYQEALDLIAYLRQKLTEVGGLPPPGSTKIDPYIGQLALSYNFAITTAATLRLLIG